MPAEHRSRAERGGPGFHNYDKRPVIRVPGSAQSWTGEEGIRRIVDHARSISTSPPVVAIDCYPGVDVDELARLVRVAEPAARIVDVEQAALSPGRLNALLADELTEDRVFGVRTELTIHQFFDPGELDRIRAQVQAHSGLIVVLGWGATLVVPDGATTALADLPRWEIQQRFRAGGTNWQADNADQDVLEKYKRGYFVEWRCADVHKRSLLDGADFLLDSTTEDIVVITGSTLRRGLQAAAERPFRVVPFFDPGPWGGHWMEQVCDLDPLPDQNYAWCFDCVPEENSLLLQVGDRTVEIPALDLVLSRPRELLGPAVVERFGAEFPIRFDFLDTMGGGNLSLQVHPLPDYIAEHFGMAYTQDESYYLLDAEPGAQVYLGLCDGADRAGLVAELTEARTGSHTVDVERYVNRFPARPHDHFLIPAGTVHASGAGSMVLEISATPFIFTFKLWDWGRLGLDGRPRPIHLDHGLANIQWDRDTRWARSTAVNAVYPLAVGEGWSAERTGLHTLEFIETVRHWFDAPVEHHTRDTVNVINLVAGDQVVVESPDGAFEPFEVHYAETFIVPAAVGPYRIRPSGTEQRYATVKAEVRGAARPQDLLTTASRGEQERSQDETSPALATGRGGVS